MAHPQSQLQEAKFPAFGLFSFNKNEYLINNQKIVYC